MSTVIEEAAAVQLPQILAIYNEVIRHSTAVYTELEWPLERIDAWFHAKQTDGLPLLVAKDSSGVTGFATFGEFRAWPCYRFTVEHSVHVRADQRGRGIGRALVEALIRRAIAMKKHTMVAGIDAQNPVSIGLHERLGFAVVGRINEVGFKFGRWLDLVFMQRVL